MVGVVLFGFMILSNYYFGIAGGGLLARQMGCSLYPKYSILYFRTLGVDEKVSELVSSFV